MEVADNTQVADLAGQTASPCSIIDVADARATAFQ